jgi:parallel beta-helix repeat protein
VGVTGFRTLPLKAHLSRLVVVAVLFALGACHSNSSTPTSPSPPVSQVKYVATSGSDRNAGTIAAPWQTLRYGVSQLQAGDTLYIRGGTYTGSENTIDSVVGTVRGGTSWSNAITIAGYSSEPVTIRPPQSGNGFGIRLSGPAASYLIFQDVIIDMVEQGGDWETAPVAIYLSGGANHNRFQRLEIRNNISFGLQFSQNNGNSPFNEVINCRIHDNGSAGVGDARNGHGMYIQTSDNLIEGNDVYNNRGYGIHAFSGSGPMNVARNTIRNNMIHGNGTHGGTAYGMVVAWGDGNLVSGNVIYSNPGGLLVYTNSSNANVSTNTIYGNSPLEGILIQYATNTVVKDNIVYGNGADIVDLGASTVLSNNHGP